MKYLILTCTLLLLCAQGNAQWAPQPKRAVPPASKSKPAQKKKKVEEPVYLKNIIYAEGLGLGGMYSLNYQRNFYLSHRWDLATRGAINPIHFSSYAPYDNTQRISLGAGILFQSIYKFKKGSELIFGMGMNGRLSYQYQTVNYNEVIATRYISKTGIVELGYGQKFGKHLYSGVSVYVFVIDKPFQAMANPGLKIGYRFGKTKES